MRYMTTFVDIHVGGHPWKGWNAYGVNRLRGVRTPLIPRVGGPAKRLSPHPSVAFCAAHHYPQGAVVGSSIQVIVIFRDAKSKIGKPRKIGLACFFKKQGRNKPRKEKKLRCNAQNVSNLGLFSYFMTGISKISGAARQYICKHIYFQPKPTFGRKLPQKTGKN